MREIAKEIRTFLKEDFHLGAYLTVIAFITVSLIYNYEVKFEKHTINSFYRKDWGYLVFTVYFIFPYYVAAFISLAYKKQLYKLRQKEFWIKSLVFFSTFGILTAFYQYRDIIFSNPDFSRNEKYYLTKIAGELKRIIPYLLIFYLIKRIFDKDETHLYGLRYKGINYRPFFWMLLIMLPLIAAASFQADFQRAYPQMKFWRYGNIFEFTEFQKSLFFELAYGLDFISVELLFRGALVIGMIKVLGKEAVLPMVAAYVFIHFGKPAGEAVSSFFGGFILGIHSYYKKNIFGGIIIHVGIAWMMEIAAILQYYYGN